MNGGGIGGVKESSRIHICGWIRVQRAVELTVIFLITPLKGLEGIRWKLVLETTSYKLMDIRAWQISSQGEVSNLGSIRKTQISLSAVLISDPFRLYTSSLALVRTLCKFTTCCSFFFWLQYLTSSIIPSKRTAQYYHYQLFVLVHKFI